MIALGQPVRIVTPGTPERVGRVVGLWGHAVMIELGDRSYVWVQESEVRVVEDEGEGVRG